MAKEIILSGIQPTGKLHIGNYFGALRHFIELQHKHQCYFCIVDYHSITADYDPKTKQAEILELAKEFLAAGLDPKKCTLFIQSYVPAHMELFHIFNTITPINELMRMTQYKDKASNQTQNINTGLLTYPILQAADILIYQATAVPVGKDQEQHLELTRKIAKFFNNKFGQTFAEPKTLFTEVPKIMSLLEPNKKMSKSLGDNHCIYLDDDPEIIKKKMAKAVTDTGDGSGQGAKNLLALTTLFSTAAVVKKFAKDSESGNLKYAELKDQLASDIAQYFADFRQAKKKLKNSEVEKIFDKGAQQANKAAEATMKEIRQKIGIR